MNRAPGGRSIFNRTSQVPFMKTSPKCALFDCDNAAGVLPKAQNLYSKAIRNIERGANFQARRRLSLCENFHIFTHATFLFMENGDDRIKLFS
jgi:hypothetical protein